MQLKDRVAFVTGGSSGIGKACAMMYAANGAKVAVVGHTPEDVEQAVKEIERAGGVAMGLTIDVADAGQVEHAVNATAQRFGRLDIVVANAGINGVWTPIEELTPEEWDKTINTNLRGSFLTIKYSVPHLKKNGGGSVIVVSSVNGTRIFSNTGATAYSTSKAGQLAMAQMLALELAKSHIRVNVICPGSVETNIGDSTTQRHTDRIKIKTDIEDPIPLSDNEPADAEQVAQLALFLASDASRHITGTPIWIDGAQSLLQG